MKRKSKLTKNAEEYANRATVHGISYIFDRDLAKLDKALWLIIVLGALCLAVWMINTSYTSWQDNQVITTLKTTTKPITDLDFPAVTICAAGQHMDNVEKVLFDKFNQWVQSDTTRINRPVEDMFSEEGFHSKQLIHLFPTE